jgi:2-oxoglutarate ferredoxin oxidoreductase subunit delta
MKAEFVVEIDEKRCKGCAICVAVCPQECLAIQDNYNPAGYFYPAIQPAAECSGCGACVKLCPDFAVTVYELLEQAG